MAGLSSQGSVQVGLLITSPTCTHDSTIYRSRTTAVLRMPTYPSAFLVFVICFDARINCISYKYYLDAELWVLSLSADPPECFDICFLQLLFDLAQTFSQYLAEIIQRLVILSNSLPCCLPTP
jgi:hypothetical protein